MRAFVVLIACLGAAGLMPALAVARRSPVMLFLAPLIGAGLAAVAALLELAVAGSLVTWFVVVAVIANLAVVVWWLAAGRFRSIPMPPWRWSVVAVLAVAAALAYPLSGLRGQRIGWDANSIWLTHALMISGGHHQLLSGLENPSYHFSNPDYPPLVPAVSALAVALFGLGDLHLGVDMTVLLNACALGVVGTGIAALANNGRPVTRIAATAAGGAICVVGFAVSAAPGIDGYADLLWAAAAVGAIVWGLVLPKSTQALVIAWICAAVASLTKNEGLTTAAIVLVLIALRYRPLSTASLRLARPWAERAAFVLLPALPGLAWAGQIRRLGIHDGFFMSPSHESLGYRASATITAMAGHLTVVPVAAALLIAGSLVLRRDRERAGLGNPAWLWTACLSSLAIIFGTYVLGAYPVVWWLPSSVGRTTVFAQLLLYAELAIWLVIAFDAAFGQDDPECSGAPRPAAVLTATR